MLCTNIKTHQKPQHCITSCAKMTISFKPCLCKRYFQFPNNISHFYFYSILTPNKFSNFVIVYIFTCVCEYKRTNFTASIKEHPIKVASCLAPLFRFHCLFILRMTFPQERPYEESVTFDAKDLRTSLKLHFSPF